MSQETGSNAFRAKFGVISSLILVIAEMFFITSAASGSTPATYSVTASGAPDSSGYCNGPELPFTPKAVKVAVQDPMGCVPLIPSSATAKFASNNFRARFLTSSGGKAAGVTLTHRYLATRSTTFIATTTTRSTATASSTTTANHATMAPAKLAATLPSRVLKLSNWYLTLPTGSSTAATVKQPQLNSYTSQYFFSKGASTGVVFHAPVSGTTTIGSTHTRSELRETASNGTLPWGWSAGSGTHIMTASEAITHLPGGNGTLGFAQIHGPSSTWYLILDAVGAGNGMAKLVVKDYTGKATGAVIDPSYRLGTRFNLVVSAINGIVGIDYNGVRKVTTNSNEKSSYFKIGAYNQSNGDFGESVVYSLLVTHS